MCGICGVVGLDQHVHWFHRMVQLLRHRGPDNTGSWNGEGVELGHTRLAIVDLTQAGNQPIPNEDGTVLLVCNGEIYNSDEIRRDLEERGHHFRSRSDSEVLLHLYEEEGGAFLPRLNGMFAFAIWDNRRRTLLLARDRLGIKPLYYYITGKKLIFASEIKAFSASPLVVSGMDPVGLKQYLTYANTFGSTTIHRGIRMIEPGQQVVWQENGSISKDYFWRPEFIDGGNVAFDDACDMFLAAAERSVKRHLMGDVEVASYLSSGYDSTTVSCLAGRHVNQPLATYTGTFRIGGWYDESKGAAAVAEGIGSRHSVVEMGAEDFKDVLDDVIYALDEPRMGMGSFSQYMVARTAAQRVKVILTGHGGDELFAGYPVFKLIGLNQKIRSSPLDALAFLSQVRSAEWPHLIYFLLQKAKTGGNSFFLPVIFTDSMLVAGLQPEVFSKLKDIEPESGLQYAVNGAEDAYQRLTLIYLRAYLPGLFVVEDKISMAHALESRIPLCDNELVDLALSLPLSVKLQAGRLKAIPKAAMRNQLPEILYRMPKRGFPTPLSRWLRHELKDWLQDRLLRKDSPLHRLFRPAFLSQFIKDYQSSWRKRVRPLDEIQTHRIWMLLSLEAWLRLSEERLGIRLELN